MYNDNSTSITQTDFDFSEGTSLIDSDLTTVSNGKSLHITGCNETYL